jgi:diguanylate cyclase (GGDEF)-like protein
MVIGERNFVMSLSRALIIVDSFDIASLDFRQLLDSAGYSTELIAYQQATLDGIKHIEPNVIFLHLSKSEIPSNNLFKLIQNEQLKNIPVVALANHKEIANQLFSIATVVLLLPVSEQRLINLFSLLGSIDKSVEKSPWDTLTGFYTPTFFNSRLKKALDHSRQIENSRFIVYTINLDYPSNHHKKNGADHREEILKGLAKVLQKVLRPTDIVSRFDSNQFMVLIEDAADSFTPATIAGRMHLEFEDYLVAAALKDKVKVDIGVIYCNSDYRSADEIVSDAQMALQLAKQDVLGSYKVFIRNRPNNKRTQLQSLVRV